MMRKGQSKLAQPNKRLRIRNDAGDAFADALGGGYDVHILTDVIEDTDEIILFFLVTVSDFAKYYNINQVFRELKAGVYGAVDTAILIRGDKINSQCSLLITRMMSSYAYSTLATASSKVALIKTVMTESVNKALNTVEQLEDMDERTEQLQEYSNKFSKKSKSVKITQRNNYYFLGCFCILIIVLIIVVITVPSLYSSSSSSSNNTSSSISSSSSSTGSSTAGPM